MLKRLMSAALFSLAATTASAADYSDVYYDPAESGWGMFVVQSDTFQFVALFVYGQDKKPTWYVAQLTEQPGGSYSGMLFATTGTYFGMPWNPADLTGPAVGTASFQPTDPYHATVTYSLTGGPTVTKTVQRQTLTPHLIAGNYSGSMAGSISACPNPADNVPSYRSRYDLDVTLGANAAATLFFDFLDAPGLNDIVCTLTGSLTHFGRLYQFNGASICRPSTVNITTSFPAVVNSLHPTTQGIEGHWTGGLTGGCTVSLHFSAVRNVDN